MIKWTKGYTTGDDFNIRRERGEELKKPEVNQNPVIYIYSKSLGLKFEPS